MAINYPTSLDSFTDKSDGEVWTAALVNDIYSAIEQLEARVGIDDEELIQSGDEILFYADSAPTGWTLQTDMNDKLVFVTKGSGASGQTGGGEHSSGTWSHDHVIKLGYASDQLYRASGEPPSNDGGSHGMDGSIAATGTSTNTPWLMTENQTTWRPAAYCFIVCSKDAYPLSS